MSVRIWSSHQPQYNVNVSILVYGRHDQAKQEDKHCFSWAHVRHITSLEVELCSLLYTNIV